MQKGFVMMLFPRRLVLLFYLDCTKMVRLLQRGAGGCSSAQKKVLSKDFILKAFVIDIQITIAVKMRSFDQKYCS